MKAHPSLTGLAEMDVRRIPGHGAKLGEVESSFTCLCYLLHRTLYKNEMSKLTQSIEHRIQRQTVPFQMFAVPPSAVMTAHLPYFPPGCADRMVAGTGAQ